VQVLALCIIGGVPEKLLIIVFLIFLIYPEKKHILFTKFSVC